MCATIITHNARLLTDIAEIVRLISSHLQASACTILVLLKISSTLGTLLRVTLFSCIRLWLLCHIKRVHVVLLIYCLDSFQYLQLAMQN